MSRSTEQWERRKWYLIRSLFEDVPVMSPIPERDESWECEDAISRPFEQLPELKIEKEPNRHDESEEFYQELEKEVLELYRKLFSNTENSSQSPDLQSNVYESCEETSQYVENPIPSEQFGSNTERNYSIGKFIDQHSFHSTEESETSSEKASNDIEQSYEEESIEIQNIPKLTDSLKDSTSESRTNETIIIQALVHQADGRESNKAYFHASDSRRENISLEIQDHSVVLSPSNIGDSDDQSKTNDQQSAFQDSSISNNEQNKVSCVSNNKEPTLETQSVTANNSSPEEPEIMRRRETRRDTVQSINALVVETDFSGDKRLETISDRQMEEAEVSPSEFCVISGNTSTPKMIRKIRHESRKRKISSIDTGTSLKKKKIANKSTQTGYRTTFNEYNWGEIQKNFFVGNPRIFKLCSCGNHECC